MNDTTAGDPAASVLTVGQIGFDDAATLLAANQGVWLRAQAEDARALPPALAAMHEELAKDFPPVIEDRALEGELRLCLQRIAEQHWRLHA